MNSTWISGIGIGNKFINPKFSFGSDLNVNDDYIEYKVVSLLGQGTFAQVFHCVDLKSEKAVAVKIVKNKPAYTRQAAVEIDVFRKDCLVQGLDEIGLTMQSADAIKEYEKTRQAVQPWVFGAIK